MDISNSMTIYVMKALSTKKKKTIVVENHIFYISDSCRIYPDHHLYNNKEKSWQFSQHSYYDYTVSSNTCLKTIDRFMSRGNLFYI